ncbi:ATP-binding cassette domain-containing protein [Nocardioides sp. dk4132]|uniref:ABC transporter ATP-binding protein n=1 Tax=unclassified Nocardioides TaxID=2615069 RepID=UPI0012969C80|nr:MULTISPECIES: ABC transporter ATP-binding protein [unclassified Nocardioides]MQW75260.1 ATP-binding cassette domain-containing protein [Nocardioides sp. dk4132]QGA07589.1 ATP-binding cassette domain-containing protein [Nocardioides sp. dk884]
MSTRTPTAPEPRGTTEPAGPPLDPAAAPPVLPSGPAPTTPGALLRRTVCRHARTLAGASALVTVWQVAELMVPVLIGVVIDRAVVTGDGWQMLLWAGVFALHFVVLSLSYRFGARMGNRALHTESHALRTEVSAHVLSGRGARADRLPGDVVSIATADAEMVAFVVRQLMFTVAGAVGLVVSAVVLAAIDPVLALVVLVGVPCVLGVTQLLSPRLAARSAVRQEALGEAAGIASDLVRGIRPLKGVAGEDAARERYRRRSQQAATASVGAARWEGVMQGMTEGLSGLFLAVVALVAGLRAVNGEIGVGEFVAVVGISQFLGEPLRMLTFLIAQLAQSRASAARIVDFLATPPLVLATREASAAGSDLPATSTTSTTSTTSATPSLALRAVSYGPLRDLTLLAEPGSSVAVVAEDPADAAALLTLLRGEAVPEAGTVVVGGRAVGELSVAQLHAALLVADHHVELFDATMRGNVDPHAALDDERLARVLRASAADEVVAQAPAGLEEHVRVGGTTLSGGQRQRLGLARALAADPGVLVLHDPTTAVDAVTEARIADGLRALRHAPGAPVRTTLVLTSSPALLAHADVVVHLRGGRVVARGTHRDLGADERYRAAVLR